MDEDARGRSHVFAGSVHEDESFDGADLSGEQLENSHFLRCSLRGVLLSSATTTGCTFEECDFTDARLNGSEHRRSSFVECTFKGASLFSGVFSGCRLIGASLEETDLTAITLSGDHALRLRPLLRQPLREG